MKRCKAARKKFEDISRKGVKLYLSGNDDGDLNVDPGDEPGTVHEPYTPPPPPSPPVIVQGPIGPDGPSPRDNPEGPEGPEPVGPPDEPNNWTQEPEDAE